MMPNPNNLMQMAQSFMNNPAQALLSAKLNVPQEMMNDPQQIVQHLLNTGQISQQQVNSAMQMRNNPMFRNLFK